MGIRLHDTMLHIEGNLTKKLTAVEKSVMIVSFGVI